MAHAKENTKHTPAMITHILEPLVGERFRNDAHYRDGHLRVINALPSRRVLGLQTPEMKDVARSLSRNGGIKIIRRFECTPNESLCYEETVIWGFLINLEKCSIDERLSMLSKYIPTLDNWAVCDSFCANAKWMARADKNILWKFLQQWFDSTNEFEVRFAIVASMSYLLNEEWIERIFMRVSNLNFDCIESEYKSIKGKPLTTQEGSVQGKKPYYVRMGAAWLLATALAKFPEKTKAFVGTSNLPEDVKKLYVRKAKESFRTRHMKAL